jgi:HEAT repeat protein
MSCYPEPMCSPGVQRGLLWGMLVGALGPATGLASAADPRQLVTAADGALEIRAGAAVWLRLQPRTPALRRGTPRFHEVDVDGHHVGEVRVPVRGSAAEEVWIGELTAPGNGNGSGGGAGAVKPAAPIWSGVTGARDADEEVGIEVEIEGDHVVEYQTATQVTRCDGEPTRLFPRAWDFDAGKFRSVVSPLPPPAEQKLVARRGDPAMPPGRPIGGFHWIAASTTASAGSDARNLTPPLALDDGNPATAWTEGLGGDGRGEFLTARSAAAGYAVRGVRIIPGDAASAAAFRGRNHLRRFQLALGPAPAQRFDVEIPDDAATNALHFAEPYWVALPKPMPASCVTLIITEVTRGSEAAPPRNFGTTAIADIAVFTDLDGPEGAARLVEDIATGSDCQQRVPLLVQLGESAVLPTAQTLLVAKGTGRECLVDALVSLAPAPGSPIVTDALVAALSGATVKEERLVTAALQRAPAPPISTLRQVLEGKGPKGEAVPIDERVRAARVLGALPQEEAAAVLVAAAGQGPEPLRAAVVKALGDSTATATATATNLPLVLSALAQFQAPAKIEATTASARYADLVHALVPSMRRKPEQRPAVLATLRTALGPTRDFEVRARAVMALGDLRAAEATGDLVSLRATSDEPVLRYLAARELVSIGGTQAVTALRDALADKDPRVRETAALGLGQLKDRWSGQPLIDAAKQEPWPFVRRAELEALGHLCGPGTGDLMVRAIERDVDQVRRAALVTLVRCKDVRTRQVLLHTVGLQKEAATLRELAAALLGELGDKTVAGDLAAAVQRLVNEAEGDIAIEGVAATALRALAHLGGPTAVATAVTLANDTRHPYRHNAIEALGGLCDPGAGAATLRVIAAGADAAAALSAQAAQHHCGLK